MCVLFFFSYFDMNFTVPVAEAAQIQIILSTLPIPPLPIIVRVCGKNIESETVKCAFDVVMAEILKSSKTDDKIVNSHSLITAMILLHKWTEYGNSTTTKEKVKTRKEKIVLDMIQAIIIINKNHDNSSSINTDIAYKLFLDTTIEWINNYKIDGMEVEISGCGLDCIEYEHIIHIAMAHYCFSQGVMYSSKTSVLKCEVHAEMQKEYMELVTRCENDSGSCEHLKIDQKNVRKESMEIAEMYSKHVYEKLLLLSYKRIEKDVLYGHTNIDKEDVCKSAQDILDLAILNFENMNTTEKTNEVASSGIGILTGENQGNTEVLSETPEETTVSNNTTPAMCQNINTENAKYVPDPPEKIIEIKIDDVRHAFDMDFTEIEKLESDVVVDFCVFVVDAVNCVEYNIISKNGCTSAYTQIESTAAIISRLQHDVQGTVFSDTKKEKQLLLDLLIFVTNQTETINGLIIRVYEFVCNILDVLDGKKHIDILKIQVYIEQLKIQNSALLEIITNHNITKIDSVTTISSNCTLSLFIREIVNCSTAVDKHNTIWYESLCSSIEYLVMLKEETKEIYKKTISIFNMKELIDILKVEIIGQDEDESIFLPSLKKRITHAIVKLEQP